MKIKLEPLFIDLEKGITYEVELVVDTDSAYYILQKVEKAVE